MFTIRPYRPEDAMGCGECFYEGFFSCPIDANDRAFLRDYGQVLVEKCNFTYVAVTREQQVVGFISGKYSKGFSKALASRCDTTRHYGAWVRMFLKFYLRGYKLSAAFQKQFEAFSSRRVKETIAIFGTAIWNSWRSPPRGIFERDWGPRWSPGSWSVQGRTAQTLYA